MKTHELVLDLEQARHLQDLGLNMSDSAFCHFTFSGGGLKGKTGFYERDRLQFIGESGVKTPAYTLQEILNKLPKEINLKGIDYFLSIFYDGEMYDFSYTHVLESLESKMGDDFLKVAYDTLCWVVENGYLEAK